MEIKCGGRVLVHSVRGVSRSATVGLAYLMIVRELTLKQAYIYLAAKRSKVEPNYGFWRDLITVEQVCFYSNLYIVAYGHNQISELKISN